MGAGQPTQAGGPWPGPPRRQGAPWRPARGPQAGDEVSLRLSWGQGLLFRTCSDSATPNAAGCCSVTPGHPELAGEARARAPSTAPSSDHLPEGLSLGLIGRPPDAG